MYLNGTGILFASFSPLCVVLNVLGTTKTSLWLPFRGGSDGGDTGRLPATPPCFNPEKYRLSRFNPGDALPVLGFQTSLDPQCSAFFRRLFLRDLYALLCDLCVLLR